MKLDRELAEKILEMPEKIRKSRPLVHMIPNSVTVALCTDGISALGARPLMAKAPEEMDEIVSYADAVVINMGQPDSEKQKAAEIALDAAAREQTPVVWDPVGAGASLYRKQAYLRLLKQNWKGIIKGNRSEIASLQSEYLPHHGIDSIGEISISYHAADERVWAVSGTEDIVFDGEKKYSFSHDREKKLLLTGTGCLTGAVMGCCYAVESDPVAAALGAFVIMAAAVEKVGLASGYGSQRTAILDALTEIRLQECSRVDELMSLITMEEFR